MSNSALFLAVVVQLAVVGMTVFCFYKVLKLPK